MIVMRGCRWIWLRIWIWLRLWLWLWLHLGARALPSFANIKVCVVVPITAADAIRPRRLSCAAPVRAGACDNAISVPGEREGARTHLTGGP